MAKKPVTVCQVKFETLSQRFRCVNKGIFNLVLGVILQHTSFLTWISYQNSLILIRKQYKKSPVYKIFLIPPGSLNGLYAL